MGDVQLLSGSHEALSLGRNVEKTKRSQRRQIHIDDDYSQVSTTINRFFYRWQFSIMTSIRPICTHNYQ
jgi:hypothetical protein